METYVYCILSFARPRYLQDLVNQLQELDSGRKIYILVDGDPKSDSRISKANDAAYLMAMDLGQHPNVNVIPRPSENLGTKAALHLLMQEGFKTAMDVVYVEDDLMLISDPAPYINQVIQVMSLEKQIKFATLFSNSEHNVSLDSNLLRISIWPELWGLVISSDRYTELKTQGAKNSNQFRHIIRKTRSKHFRNLIGLFSSRFFVSNWVFKFDRSMKSRSAWDTELHSELWESEGFVILPQKSLIRDRGTDWTSISPGKSAVELKTCSRDCQDYLFQASQLRIKRCKHCDNRKYLENSGLPKKLQKIILRLQAF